MKRSQALPGKYLAKEDVDNPVLCTVDVVKLESVKTEHGAEDKPVLYVMNPSDPSLDTSRGIILNHTNWSLLEQICGSDDSDNWTGKKIVLFHDPNVSFGGRLVGGIRVRAPRQQQPQAPAPPPEPEPVQDESIPF